jgi:hypothetical protein
MGVDEFFRLRARLVELARSVEADPANIGVLSTGEACAVALSAASIYSKTTTTRWTRWNGSAPSGKKRCAIFTPPAGGNDQAPRVSNLMTPPPSGRN